MKLLLEVALDRELLELSFDVLDMWLFRRTLYILDILPLWFPGLNLPSYIASVTPARTAGKILVPTKSCSIIKVFLLTTESFLRNAEHFPLSDEGQGGTAY